MTFNPLTDTEDSSERERRASPRVTLRQTGRAAILAEAQRRAARDLHATCRYTLRDIALVLGRSVPFIRQALCKTGHPGDAPSSNAATDTDA